MENLSEYLHHIQESKKVIDPSKAETALEIETAMNNGDFIVTSDCEFNCRKLSEVDCEDLEEAIKQYWDDSGIDWLEIERNGTRFKISTKTKK